MELPELQHLWSEVSKQRDDVVFLAVNIGDQEQVINDYWSESGFTFPAVQQGGKASAAFKVMAYPSNFVIGPDGTVLFGEVGYNERGIRKALASTMSKSEK